ncbi:MAG: hypothetical protein EBZ36_09100 [Acidobacteria bacterium]|nr:hypothetical protein [Acidobacteriota bacterium]
MLNKEHFRFVIFLVFTVPVVTVLLLTTPASVTSGESGGTSSAIWQVAPPSPEIPEAERLAELRRRRAAALDRMSPESVMILFSAEPRIYTNDVDYHYRQENNLYYLTGIRQNGAVLMLIPGARRTREILFMPPRDSRYETWNGRMMSLDEARARSGIAEVREVGGLTGLLAALLPVAGAG